MFGQGRHLATAELGQPLDGLSIATNAADHIKACTRQGLPSPEVRTVRQPSAGPAKASRCRYCAGLCPVQRRKARRKALSVE